MPKFINHKTLSGQGFTWEGQTLRKLKESFTLAEILITLTILGIITVISLSSLIGIYHEKQTVVAVKKIYAELQKAFDMAERYDGPVDTWVNLSSDWGSANNGNRNTKYADYLIKENFKVKKACGVTDDGCGVTQEGICKNLNGDLVTGSNNFYNFCNKDTWIWNYAGKWNRTLLNNGTTIAIKAPRTGSIEGDGGGITIAVDLNGEKSPNTFGKDIFFFLMTTKGIEPVKGNYNTYCNINSNDASNGISCLKYIIENENMNYLKQ